MKILFVASEALPFIKTGGLGDVAGALPQSFARLGHDARVIIPFYKEEIREELTKDFEFVGSTQVSLGWRSQYCGIYQTKVDGVIYYFVDNEYYFKRRGLYGHFDDGERFAYFSKAVLDALSVIDFYPNVLHANDWHSALVPVFLDVFYRHNENYREIKSVYTIHNIEFQGKYDPWIVGDVLGLPEWARPLVMNDGCVNFMKGGIECASVVTTVSQTYATEIRDPFYSYGLDGILSARQYKVFGVVNGIDVNRNNPKTDKALFVNYDSKTVAKKEDNKKALCEMLNLPYKEGRPMIAMVTRLTEQKGMNLVAEVIDEIIRADLQMVVLGTGDYGYEELVRRTDGNYPTKFRGILQFSTDLASKLYAASDMFLMPSKFEPCGLSQLIAMRYGSVPIVRETGGLKDTVKPYNPQEKTGRGFTFKTYNSYDMLDAVWRAFGTYFDKENWQIVQQNAMNGDYGWDESAKQYIQIYNK